MARINVDDELIKKIQTIYQESEGLNSTATVDWALRKLAYLKPLERRTQ